MAHQAGKTQSAPAKHVPQRMCVACRATDGKRELVRVVRTAEGRVHVDESGKARGRGAYVCRRPACWAAALQRRALERALRIEHVQAEDLAALQAFSQSLPKPEATETQAQSAAS